MQSKKDFQQQELTRKYNLLKQIFEQVLRKYCDQEENQKWRDKAELPKAKRFEDTSIYKKAIPHFTEEEWMEYLQRLHHDFSRL